MNLSQEEDSRPLFYVGEDVLVRSTLPKGEEDLKIVLGVCAMKKKSDSKPMREILDRLEKYMHIQTLTFDEDVILNSPIEDWPIVDVLIAFFSHGFPLQKAIAYADLRKPFLINDLESQFTLLDRREVYKTLMKEGISHPRYAVLMREENGSTECKVTDADDSIEINGVMFHKPFVEKPISAEDHNIYIYFPGSAGGGSQRLFRKVGSRSSVYSSVSRVRKKGSFIYEDFMPTDGTDVKVYTLGPDYAHAEARKSPALDGKVERDKNGKEIRYPVLLSAREKMLARKVCHAFKQNICGFDLLRASGKSYVCDVNGFSFVKNSVKYYDDCAKILGTMIMRACAPQLHIPWVLGSAPEDIPVVPTTSGSMMELRSVVAVIRHGDRTPKQKMKMEVKHKKFFELFEKYDGYKSGHLKLKKPKQLQEVLDIARFLLSEQYTTQDAEVAEKKAKLQQLKLVLEMYGHFSGINRKVQLKYQPYGHPQRSSSEEDEYPREPSLLLIVKWGGELTPAGKIQAEDLGKAFRTLYPGGQGQFETPGLGFLRLHSTFRHDLKIYASDEGRVQMTAAAFAKGLLALEGELTPILVQMVKSANTNGLLDKQGESSKYQSVVKDRLTHILNENREFVDEDYDKLAPTRSESLYRAIDFIKNPFRLCQHVHNMVKELTAKVRSLKLQHRTRELKLYNGESWELLIRRWAKLEKDFKMKDGRFDISKIPDIYDCIKYDLQHNQKILQYSSAQDLFNCSKALADIVIPQEYGITVEEKLHISQSLCTPLMRKIMSDLEQCAGMTDEDQSTRLDSKYSKGVASPERFVRTRLYFTSESHIHSLLNMLRYGGLRDENSEEQWKKAMDYINATPELNYMTQIIIMMFEDPTKETNSDERFHIELHFSPGAYLSCDEKTPIGQGCNTLSFKGKEIGKDLSSYLHEHGFDPNAPLKRLHERPVSAPMIIQEQEEIDEAEMFEHISRFPHDIAEEDSEDIKEESPPPVSSKFQKVSVPESSLGVTVSRTSSGGIGVPKSPDPNVPEWDWGSDPENTEESHTQKESSSCDLPPGKSVSEPIEIKPTGVEVPRKPDERARSLSLEEKRSRSLEDKKTDKKPDVSEMHDRHYLTVHLPLASNRQHHSFSSLFYLTPESFKDTSISPSDMDLCRAHSTSVLISKSNAFEGFSMVPSLRPLETLHNKLTLLDMDDFLKKATTYKFVTPVSSPPARHTPSASPCVQPLKTHFRGQSQPSSSNSSSAGPSSPTSSGPPLNSLISKLQNVIIDNQNSKGESESKTFKGDNSGQECTVNVCSAKADVCESTVFKGDNPGHGTIDGICDSRTRDEDIDKGDRVSSPSTGVIYHRSEGPS